MSLSSFIEEFQNREQSTTKGHDVLKRPDSPPLMGAMEEEDGENLMTKKMQQIDCR